DRIEQDIQRYARADGESGLLQPFARFGPERVGAGQPLTVAEQCQKAVRSVVRARVSRRLRDVCDVSRAAALRIGCPDRCSLRIREYNAWYSLVVRYARCAENIRCHDPALVLPGVRQLPEAGDIA